MKTQKTSKLKSSKTVITTGSTNDFFARGKKIAHLIDSKQKIKTKRTIISFEDPQDLVKFISEKKRDLIRLIRLRPESITSLAQKLHRQRASVDKDIRILETYGLVKTYYETNPGHGKCKIVRPISAEPIEMRACF